MKKLHPYFTRPLAGISRPLLLRTRPAIAIAGAALLALVGVSPANAAQIIRELWDGPNSKFALNGVGDGPSSFGFAPGTTWVTSPAGNTSLRFDGTWNLDWMIGDGDTLLPPTGNGNGGTLAYYGGDGNMQSSLTNPATGLPYGDYSSQCYAMRALATNSYINLNANGTYYFSVRLVGGSGWTWWSGDMAGGVGFAASNATNADFVGAGWSRLSPFLMADGVTDAGSADYITTGTLDQAGVASHPDDSGGPYYPRAAGAAGMLANAGPGFVLVGQLTTSLGGACAISVTAYPGYNSPPADPGSIVWDATYSFTDTNLMTQLLLWDYGTGPAVQDAVRVGTAWGDVIGLEVVGAPKASPASTVYAGTTVTLSQTAGLNSGTYPMSFQWRSNNVDIADATNASLVLTSATTDFTADYSVVVSNYFGMLTSAVHLTVMPAVPPLLTTQPVSLSRYMGAPAASFSVGVNGTPPFGLQLQHAGTNVPGATAQLSEVGTGTLTIGPLGATAAGGYSVLVTNQFGSTNSQTATLTLLTPAPGSFEAAAVAAGAAAFWRVSESTNDWTPAGVPLHEYMAGLNGNCPDTNNTSFGLAGPGFAGMAGQTSIGTWNDGNSSQINLAGMMQYSNTMTLVCWMNASYLGSQAIMLDTGGASGNGLGDGPYFGIDYRLSSLGSQWGDTNSIWASGLELPPNQWVMVALVVDTNETTVYAGTDPFTLQKVTRSSVEGVSYANTNGTLSNGRLALGRTDYAWAQYNNSWAGMNAQFSDAAVWYRSLAPSAITNLFLAGVGVQVSGTPDGSGNLVLNWLPGGTLQEANSVTGPYTDVSSSPTPPYYAPISAATHQHYYRVRR